MQKLDDAVLLTAVQAVSDHGSQHAAAKALGISQGRISERVAEAKKRGLIQEKAGQIEALEAKELPLPAKGQKAVYILTCAQDHTHLHEKCWNNLRAIAAHYKATILVSTFKYNKEALGQRANAKFETREQEVAALYPKEIIPFICDERVDLTPNLTWCGELNLLPTADNPLGRMASYTYRKSTIVPHPKLALTSVPAMKGEGVKLLMTTGCVTQRNYVKRKVGFIAEHYHSYGALLVEIDDEGRWWTRQLQMGHDDAIYDLTIRAKDGKITDGHRVADITWGDVHALRLNPKIAEISWGKNDDSMIEVLKPKTQHVHDILDFSPRSHHSRKDPYLVYESHLNGEWVLTDELQLTARVLWDDMTRAWVETFVVNSNHDRHLDIFLKDVDWRDDPVNARLILALNLKMLDSITAAVNNGTKNELNLMEHALKLARHNAMLEHPRRTENHVQFLHEDEKHIILEEIDGGIECGLHGDRGANGSKGTISGIAKLDRRVNGADKHTAAIMNHAYFCGASCELVQGWNKGLSTWTNAHTITYPNATRTLISLWKGKWRA